MQVQQNRLPSIVGDTPTAASIARYQERLRNAYMPPVRRSGETDDAFDQRQSAAMASAQRRVSPPMLPIIGHGTQLAAIRLQALAQPIVEQNYDTRQQKRRIALKARKAAESAARKEVIRTRRQKVSRYAK